jgi:hypothetical protein
MQSFLDSKDVIDDGQELADRMARDGYLFVSGLLPREPVQNLRMKVLEIARDAGWVRADRLLKDGIADRSGFCVDPEPAFLSVFSRMNKLPEYHALPHHPNLIGMLERMLGDAVMSHASIIGRNIFPQHDAVTTRAHQDSTSIQGTPDTYTAWVPFSDVPPEMGGLAIARGSHEDGPQDIRPVMGAGGLGVAEEREYEWVNSPFEQGDVLFFHSMTVHKGLPCRGERLRQSMDVRYQRISDPIAPGSLTPYRAPKNWEEVYADWPTDDLKYYWRKWDLNIVDYDLSYLHKRDSMAFEMAENGDPNAISALQRIIALDRNPEKVRKAEELLAGLDESILYN